MYGDITPGGGALECQGGYQARPKIHVIRVVFQDQALYTRTSFRGEGDQFKVNMGEKKLISNIDIEMYLTLLENI